MTYHRIFRIVSLPGLLLTGNLAVAAVLPDEKIDLMSHSYDGGELEVSGPAILIRKNVGSSASVFYSAYTDNITSASIDVQISGSPYKEERTEQTIGLDFLKGKTTMNLSVTDSTENDYQASTLSFGISQDFFGDLSTLSMGYSRGEDAISERTANDANGNPIAFGDRAEILRQSFRVGFSQILSKNLTVAFGFETITDEATSAVGSTTTLNNPYRQYSFRAPGNPDNRSFADEIYPRTRTSNAASIRTAYHLPWKAAVHFEYRQFADSWGIKASNYGVTYVQPIGPFTVDFRWRAYSQTQAEFYSDLFEFQNEFTYMARDKELSSYSNVSTGITISYEFAKNGWGFIDKGSLVFSYDLISFEYENFRDARENQGVSGSLAAGSEPLYAFDADVIAILLSIWY